MDFFFFFYFGFHQPKSMSKNKKTKRKIAIGWMIERLNHWEWRLVSAPLQYPAKALTWWPTKEHRLLFSCFTLNDTNCSRILIKIRWRNVVVISYITILVNLPIKICIPSEIGNFTFRNGSLIVTCHIQNSSITIVHWPNRH